MEIVHYIILQGQVIDQNVINWNNSPRYWPFVKGIHRSPMDSPHKGQWRRDLSFLWYGPEQTTEQTIEMLVI